MPNVRLFPPAVARQGTNPITVRGNVYQSAIGTPLDVPMADADVLIGNGWTPIARGGGRGSAEPAQVGTTAQRPTASLGSGTPLTPGSQYVDTDVGGIITWDGATWRAYDGSAV